MSENNKDFGAPSPADTNPTEPLQAASSHEQQQPAEPAQGENPTSGDAPQAPADADPAASAADAQKATPAPAKMPAKRGQTRPVRKPGQSAGKQPARNAGQAKRQAAAGAAKTPGGSAEPASKGPETHHDGTLTPEVLLREIKGQVAQYKADLKRAFEIREATQKKGTKKRQDEAATFYTERSADVEQYLHSKDADAGDAFYQAYKKLIEEGDAATQEDKDAAAKAEAEFYKKFESFNDDKAEPELEDITKALDENDEIARERLEAALQQAFGQRVTERLTDHIKERIRTEKKLIDIVEKMMRENRGEAIDKNSAYVNALVQTFQRAHDKDEMFGRIGRPVVPWHGNPDVMNRPQSDTRSKVSLYAGKIAMIPFNLRMKFSEKSRQKYDNATPEEKKKMERRAKRVGKALMVAAVAGAGIKTYLGVRYSFDHSYGSAAGPRHDGIRLADHNYSLSPEDLAHSHQTEMDFLHSNHRIGNDFNSITPDKFNNVPGDTGHFPGYTALQEQYTKSPTELAAQVHQIQQIQLANNQHFDALPQDLQLQPGENPDAYAARLSDALHHDQSLHDKVANATLQYIQVNGKLEDLDRSYMTWYIDDKGVAHWQTKAISSGQGDWIVRLAGTNKGIRYPCGQPVEFVTVEQVAATQGAAPQPEQIVTGQTSYVQNSVDESVQVVTQTNIGQQYYPAPRPRWRPHDYTPPLTPKGPERADAHDTQLTGTYKPPQKVNTGSQSTGNINSHQGAPAPSIRASKPPVAPPASHNAGPRIATQHPAVHAGRVGSK